MDRLDCAERGNQTTIRIEAELEKRCVWTGESDIFNKICLAADKTKCLTAITSLRTEVRGNIKTLCVSEHMSFCSIRHFMCPYIAQRQL